VGTDFPKEVPQEHMGISLAKERIEQRRGKKRKGKRVRKKNMLHGTISIVGRE
jgi:hypothetical protein